MHSGQLQPKRMSLQRLL